MRCHRWLLGAIAAMLVGCAPQPVVGCGLGVSGVEKTFFDGVWAHTIQVETRAGPMLLPNDIELGNVSFAHRENFIYGIEGLAVSVVFRVISHFRVEEGRCGDRILENDGRPWTERGFARVDWSIELAGAPLRDLLPDHEIEPISLFVSDEDDVTPPRFEEGAAGTPTQFEIVSDYLVRPPGCVDTSCTSHVRVRHVFVRR